MDDFRHTAEQAYAAVDVPDSVVDILAELRCYLQDKCEPPMYVSDRRFMKAVQMLQVRWSIALWLYAVGMRPSGKLPQLRFLYVQ